MKKSNFACFALTLLVTLFAVVNAFPSSQLDKRRLTKFTKCDRPGFPIEVSMFPDPPVNGENVFTISGNFTLPYHATFSFLFQNSKNIYTISKDCGVNGCPAYRPFKLLVKFDLEAPKILSGKYNLTVNIIGVPDPVEILGCAKATICKK